MKLRKMHDFVLPVRNNFKGKFIKLIGTLPIKNVWYHTSSNNNEQLRSYDS